MKISTRTILICLLINIFCFLNVFHVNAQDDSSDLGIRQEDIRFSKEKNNMIVGEKIRVYASVYNNSDNDASGYLSFYENNENNLLGSVEVSVIAGGYYDEVYTDFIVPSENFRILVKLLSTVPADTNSSNDFILTDKIIAQGDNDGDGLGDNIDPDDDNDTLTDENEASIGTNKDNQDTDGDGVIDPEDEFPLDPNKSKAEVQKVEPVIPENVDKTPVVENKAVVQELKETTVPAILSAPQKQTKVNKPKNKNEKLADEDFDGQIEVVEQFFNSPDIEMLEQVRIVINQLNWNTYNFSFRTNLPDLDSSDLDYVWVFSDDTEMKSNGAHKFTTSGEYFVTLKVNGPWGNSFVDNVKITVKFWSVYNYWLWLIFLVIIGLVFLYVYEFNFKGFKSKKHK